VIAAMLLIHEEYTMQPYVWWAMYGTPLPKLQAIAMKVLSQSATASACEQNWINFQ